MLSDIRDQIETPEWTREQRGPRMISFELAGVAKVSDCSSSAD
jgi:hypothetical protein